MLSYFRKKDQDGHQMPPTVDEQYDGEEEEGQEEWMAEDRSSIGGRQQEQPTPVVQYFPEAPFDDDDDDAPNRRRTEVTFHDSHLTETFNIPSSRQLSGKEQLSKRNRKHARRFSMIGADTIVKDHFSLSHPSSTVTFDHSETMVFVNDFEQTVLQKKEGNNYITAKQMTVSSPGLTLFRIIYALVASLMSGFLFVFCVQVILFLFLGVAIESGLTSQKGLNFFTFFGTLFSIPVFISGLSQVMAIATAFVIDTWKGSKFMKTVVSWDSTLVDWVTLFVFFGFPICLGTALLFSGNSDWWTILSISWFSLVFVYYIIFAIAAVYYEIDGCFELMRYHPKLRKNHNPDDTVYTLNVFQDAIELSMKQALSGNMYISYNTQGNEQDPATLSYKDSSEKSYIRTFIGPMSRLTKTRLLSRLYTVLDEPFRQYNVNDVLEFTPFVTRSSWGLESIYCRDRSARFIAIIDGPSAVTREQAKSSLVCFIIGFCLTTLGLVSVLVWFQLPFYVILVVLLIYLARVYKNARSSFLLNASYDNALTREDGEDLAVSRDRPSGALYNMEEMYRISEPSPKFCYIALGLAILLFFVIPLIALFTAKNTRVGVIFIFMGLGTLLRSVFNAPTCLRELGSLDGMELNNDRGKDGLSEWREKHRFGRIIGEISVGKNSKIWFRVFVVFTLGFCVLLTSAFTLGAKIEGQGGPMKFVGRDDFVYVNSNASKYASCATNHDIKTSNGDPTWLADMVFLSRAADLDKDSVSQALADWFGDTPVEDLHSNVTEFKEIYQKDNGASAVSYKLFDFPDQNLKVVAVRGTSNSWDALADAQLWTSAVLAQLVRAILPFGNFWDPILPLLVEAISIIEEGTLENVSYYKETTAFVDLLKSQGYNVQIVGHSLGGGIAMITGAQTETPSAAISGPNSKISRRTYSPPITTEALDKFAFNIIPGRDPVPRVDDPAKNYQPIECKAPSNKFFDCHMATRSLCEILFTCGSTGRPIPCACVNKYEYEEPISLNGKVFSEVCSHQEED